MKKDLKNKIISAFASSTPDLSEKIKEKSENQPIEPLKSENVQVESKKKKSFYIKRAVFAFSFALIFALGAVLGNVISFPKSEKVKATSEFYIDINPSVKLEISGYKTVVSAKALNDDAKSVLEGLNLNGVEVNTAVYAIVGKMLGMGYLSDETATNSILFSVCGEENGQSDFITEITDEVNKFLTNCSVITQLITVDEEVERKAEEYDISVGKMAFIDKIIGRDEAYEGKQNEFAEKSIKELALMFNHNRDEGPSGDLVKGDETFENDYDILNKVVEQAKTDYSFDVERVCGEEISIVFDVERGKIYKISFEVNRQRYFYEYECKTETVVDKTQENQIPSKPLDPPFDEDQREWGKENPFN